MRLTEYLALPKAHVDVGTARIAYRTMGSGPPLIFIHGWPLTGATYRHLLPELSQYFTCILPDSPGIGETEWTEATDFHFVAQAEVFQRFVQELSLDQYSLIAHDTGATIARILAAHEEDKIDRFVILNTEIPGKRAGYFGIYLALMRLPGTVRLSRRIMGWKRFVEARYGFGCCFSDRSKFDDDFYAAYVTPLLEDDRRWMGAIRYVGGIDWSVVDGLPHIHARIQAPVLMVWGADDPIFPVEAARPMAADFPTCVGFVEIPRGKLMFYEEFPDQVLASIVPFLRNE